MDLRCPLAALVLTAASTLAGAASAGEMYRWEDRSGRVHFGESPPSDAVRVQRVDGLGEGRVINVAPDAATPPGAHRAESQRSPQRKKASPARPSHRDPELDEPTVIQGKTESQWRSDVQRLAKRIGELETQLEYAEDQLSSAYALGSAAYYQRRVDSLKSQLELAKEGLERMEDDAREAGVPPGWLRD